MATGGVLLLLAVHIRELPIASEAVEVDVGRNRGAVAAADCAAGRGAFPRHQSRGSAHREGSTSTCQD